MKTRKNNTNEIDTQSTNFCTDFTNDGNTLTDRPNGKHFHDF